MSWIPSGRIIFSDQCGSGANSASQNCYQIICRMFWQGKIVWRKTGHPFSVGFWVEFEKTSLHISFHLCWYPFFLTVLQTGTQSSIKYILFYAFIHKLWTYVHFPKWAWPLFFIYTKTDFRLIVVIKIIVFLNENIRDTFVMVADGSMVNMCVPIVSSTELVK